MIATLTQQPKEDGSEPVTKRHQLIMAVKTIEKPFGITYTISIKNAMHSTFTEVTLPLGSCAARRVGSTPTTRTKKRLQTHVVWSSSFMYHPVRMAYTIH